MYFFQWAAVSEDCCFALCAYGSSPAIILLAEWWPVITFISFIRCSLDLIPRSFVSTSSSHSDKISPLTFSSLKVSWYCLSPKASNSVSTYCVCVCVGRGGKGRSQIIKWRAVLCKWLSHIFCTHPDPCKTRICTLTRPYYQAICHICQRLSQMASLWSMWVPLIMKLNIIPSCASSTPPSSTSLAPSFAELPLRAGLIRTL